ncbi:MAG: aldo/keto reductase [Pseudomonadota bacterium]|nr:aldo/keto reductase [Pseudomonadota bacterium]
MQYRALGNSGIDASIIGLGTWATGVDADEKSSIQIIHGALDAGVTLIDTAPSYGWGRSEEIVGRAIRGRRDQVVLATKCGIWWADARGSASGKKDGKDIYVCIDPATIRLEVEASLKRLKVDTLDLLQVHRPALEPDKMPVADTMGCLMDLKREGKIRAIGVSNVNLDQLTEYQSFGCVDSNQLRYNMLNREAEAEALAHCHVHNIAAMTYTSLEQGLLTGKVTPDRSYEESDWRRNAGQWMPWFKEHNLKKLLEVFTGWDDLLESYGATIPQLVVAWTASRPHATHVLCGSRSVPQVQENALGGGLRLTGRDIERMTLDLDKLGAPR